MSLNEQTGRWCGRWLICSLLILCLVVSSSAAPSPPPLELVGLEVIQAIQDLTNSVQMITDKTTYVRAYVQSSAARKKPVTAKAQLRGFRAGRELPGSPLSAINSGGSITAKPNAVDLRDRLEASLNFRLPEAWLNGTIRLRVERVGGGDFTCREAAGTPNDCSVEVTFNATKKPAVKFIGVQWTDAGGVKHEPSAENMRELQRRLVAIYPIASLDSSTDTLKWTGAVPPPKRKVNEKLEWTRFWDRCWVGCERLYYGVLRGPDAQEDSVKDGKKVKTQFAGLANGIPGTVSCGTMPDAEYEYRRNVHAHELGHDLGRRHALYCGAEDAKAPAFPFTTVLNNGKTVATLGPMDKGRDRLIFGLDTAPLKVIDPGQNFELMSYCGRPSDPFADSRFKWISQFTYDAIRTAINQRFNRAAAALVTGTAEDYLVVRGSVDFVDDTAQLEPFGTISSSLPPPVPPPGDYTLRLLDPGGHILADVSFQPTEYEADGPGNEPGFGTFIIPVLAHPDIKHAVVLHKGTMLTLRSASSNPPTVRVISPNGGETFNGDSLTIRWEGGDIDGDPLVYLVQYSPDGGATWQTLVTDWPDQSYQIPLTLLTGTTNALVRVMASDGFDSATDDSDGAFSVRNSAPEISILSPSRNGLFTNGQVIGFEAFAQDREDGALTGLSVRWTSNIDGLLGTGTFIKDAADLSEGTHVITATATDSAGLTSAAFVTITVISVGESAVILSTSGSASRVGTVPRSGQDAGAQVSIVEKFSVTNALDLRTAAVTITKLLTEVEGAGELVRRGVDADLLPVTLVARSSSTAGSAIYETLPGVTPAIRVTIAAKSEGTFDLRVRIDKGTIPTSPQFCVGDPRLTTDLTTELIIDDRVNPRVLISAVAAWRCLDLIANDPRAPRSLRAP